MFDADRVAEQNQALEGYKLADYRSVALPYYVIYVEAVVLERRSLKAVTEFVFRAIKTGLTAPNDIRQFLGLEARFFDKLIEQLCEDRFTASTEGALRLLAKGEQTLSQAHEVVPQEREIPLVWDLLQRKPSGYLETLIREAEAKRDGLLLIRARPMRAPVISEIPLHAVQQAWAQRQRVRTEDNTEVIRLRDATRRLLRYRPAVGLVYVQEKGAGVRVRFAVNGKVDDEIAKGFAEQNGPKHMGIASEFGRKTSTLAIRTRLRELPGEIAGVEEFSMLLKKRATARLALEGLQRRMEEDASEDLRPRYAEKQAELHGLDAQIGALPIREILPYETGQLTRESFRRARRRLVMTTRIPSKDGLSPEIVAEIKAATARGVKVSIFLTGRVPSDESGAGRWNPVRELDKLVNAVEGVDVGFLLELKRSIFEIVVDNEFLVVSNRSPLGEVSSSGSEFQPFSGVVVSDALAVRAYISAHLDEKNLQITKRMASRVTPRTSRKGSIPPIHPRGEQRKQYRRPRK